MEIKIEIDEKGDSTVWAINIREDLLHDYVYFRAQAKRFDESNPKAVFMHKRYLRAALLVLFAYAEAVTNGWIAEILKKQSKSHQYNSKRQLNLFKKFKFIEASTSVQVPSITDGKKLRNSLSHFNPGEDGRVFEETTIAALAALESELAKWMGKIEQSLGTERHPNSREMAEAFSLELGTVTNKASSEDETV